MNTEELVLSPEAKKDILELQEKIQKFKDGEIPEERFKAYRLTRGVYGQRQEGVQMFRIKLPFGKISPNQIRTIADMAGHYGHGNLHLTTRQNIQLHYVDVANAPRIWEALESSGLTAREACGNTVRNITASPLAGIDPNEPFDVSPFANAVFEYFLRNPVCQDMGRKIKMAFSSSDKDSAFTYIHDFGFIPKVQNGNKGFKVVVGGGLGAQAFMAETAYEFLPAERLIPFIEAGLRVFDRFGERERRNKARLKFLIEPKKGIGLSKFLELVEEEEKALPNKQFEIKDDLDAQIPALYENGIEEEVSDEFLGWKASNVFEQKQSGYYAVKVKVPLGDLSVEIARKFASIAEKWASNDIRLTINQGVLLKYVTEGKLPGLFSDLQSIGLGEEGFDTLSDVTACPGTDTCNLAVTNSTDISFVLEDLIKREFPQFKNDPSISIKISGCMNSCGQHMIASIGFHGSSIKYDGKVAPAMQVVLGGGVDPEGKGFIAEKVIKVPTKKVPDVIRFLLQDFENNADLDEEFNEYVRRQGKIYFYDLLKILADSSKLIESDFQDWGKEITYKPEIGVGECASVVFDLVSTIIGDAKERLQWAKEDFESSKWANAIYQSYSAFVIGAKGLLLDKGVQCNTHNKIIADFDEHFVKSGEFQLETSFKELVLQINKNEPTKDFATGYLKRADQFLQQLDAFRNASGEEKMVVSIFTKHDGHWTIDTSRCRSWRSRSNLP